MVRTITRRKALLLLSAGTGTVLAGCTVPKGDTADIIDLTELDTVLEIPAGTTYTISSGRTETYDSVRWESDGALELAPDSTIEMTTLAGEENAR